jgi:hypothetical protein
LRIEARRTLPSFVYIDDQEYVGTWAREQGALVPTKSVNSAKSWLSNPEVDRKRIELEAAMSAVEGLMRNTFLHGGAVLESKVVAYSSNHPNLRRGPMGDKIPKSIERQKKQSTVNKNQKKANAFAKAHPSPCRQEGQ